MLSLILSRLAQAVPVLLVVGLIAFGMFKFVGDPVTIMLGTTYTEQQKIDLIKENLQEVLRPDIIEDVIVKQKRPLRIYWGRYIYLGFAFLPLPR